MTAIQVNLNDVRYSAARNMDLLIKFLNARLSEEDSQGFKKIEDFYIHDCDNDEWQSFKSFEEIINDLRADIVVI